MSVPVEPQYTFVVLDRKNQSFPVMFEKADQRAKEYFQSIWKRMNGAIEEFHKADAKFDSTGARPMPDWGRWSPWDWCLTSKPEVARREMWIAWCGSRMIGFLSLWSDFPSQSAVGQSTLYVEHLAAFPGDIDTLLWDRHYRGVGGVLLAYAIYKSEEKGFKCRLSLHASNAEALAFYRSLNTKLNDKLFHPEQVGILGPTPQATRYDASRTYLETTEAGAREWLESYRDA